MDIRYICAFQPKSYSKMDPSLLEFSHDSTLLHPTDLELPYRRRAEEEKLAIHYGQLKLLISEIYFLTLYGMSREVTVVYAGAAPGIHIPFLSRMFPHVDFHLYDPSKFRIEPTNKIHLYTQYFTETDAQKWSCDSRSTSGETLLFISDIRSLDDDDLVMTKVSGEEESQRRVEADVNKNMRDQETYYKIIRPHRALMKMRLPYAYKWSPPSYRYLDGDIFKQAFAPQTSTETRIVPSSGEEIIPSSGGRGGGRGGEIDYDIRKYESQMFHHNVIIREKNRYNVPVMDQKFGITNDYDSAYMMFVLTTYLNTKMNSVTEGMIRQLARDLLSSLNPRMTLLSLRTGPIHSTSKIAKCRNAIESQRREIDKKTPRRH